MHRGDRAVDGTLPAGGPSAGLRAATSVPAESMGSWVGRRAAAIDPLWGFSRGVVVPVTSMALRISAWKPLETLRISP